MKRLIVTLVSMLFLMRCYAQHYLHVSSKSTPIDTVCIDSVSIRYADNKLYLYQYFERGLVFWKQLHLQKESSWYKKYGFFDPILGCIIIDKDGNASYSYHPRLRKVVKVSKMNKETLEYILKQSTTHMSHYDHSSHMSHYSSR